jgi:hypothetical protein
VLGTITATISSAQIASALAQEIAPSGKAAKIGALLKADGATLPLTALEPGGVLVQWFLVPPGAKLSRTAKPVQVASGQASFSAAGTSKLKVKLTSAGKQLLKRSHSLKLTAKGTFTPSGAAGVVATKGFSVKR